MNNNFKILVTFRNAEKYIGKSLDSTLCQTYQNFKILLVNDASSDNSHEICQRYVDKYPEKIIYKRNQDRLNATFTKPGIDSKRKTYSRSTELSVSLSRNQESGTDVNTSINDGLTYNSYYGLRVQDEEISLNYPDVSKVIAIYESLDSSAPTLDAIKCLSTSNIDQGAIVGENISSKTSNTVARYVKSTEEDKAQIVEEQRP